MHAKNLADEIQVMINAQIDLMTRVAHFTSSEYATKQVLDSARALEQAHHFLSLMAECQKPTTKAV